MKDSVEFGANKTATQTKPLLTEKMISGYETFPVEPVDTTVSEFDLRSDYIREAEQLSTVPLPGTAKGVISSAMQTLKGNSAAVLVDKLGERLAYERTGVRLYDALIRKCRAAAPELDVSTLEQFRHEEHEHMLMCRDALLKIGADPTAQTPCADMNGMAAMGLIQVMNDPRTTVPQCAETQLMAEVIDVAAWELLIDLVTEAGLDDIAQKFQAAKIQEDKHMMVIKDWLRTMTLENAAAPIPMSRDLS